jgi:hypothetical protein
MIVTLCLLHSSFTFSGQKLPYIDDSDAEQYYRAIGPHTSVQNYILMQILSGDKLHTSRITSILSPIYTAYETLRHDIDDIQNLYDESSVIITMRQWLDLNFNEPGTLRSINDALTQQIKGINALFLNITQHEVFDIIASVFTGDSESSLTNKLAGISHVIDPIDSDIAVLLNDISSDVEPEMLRVKYVGQYVISKCYRSVQHLNETVQIVKNELIQFFDGEEPSFFADNLLSRINQILEQTKQNGDYLKQLCGFFKSKSLSRTK